MTNPSPTGDSVDLLVLIAGAGKLLGANWAYASVDHATGQVNSAKGLRVPGGVVMDLEPLLDTRPLAFEIQWSDGHSITSTHEVRFQLVRDGKQLRTTARDNVHSRCPSGSPLW